ncbi:MAG: ribonuclease III [Balneolales bacterium]
MLSRIRAYLFKSRALDPASARKIAFLEKVIGSRIRKPLFFLKALRHRSSLIEKNLDQSESYEQFEFLGDAVLDLVVSDIIFARYPSEDEGFMTQLRAKLVNGATLAGLARKLDLASVIEVGSRVRDQGIEQSEGVLADTFEAVVGALYTEKGYATTYTFVSGIYEHYTDLDELVLSEDNYKSRLLEAAQARKLSIPVYKTLSEKGPPHKKKFEVQVIVGGEVQGTGTGKSKKKAEQKAAKAALERMKLS